MGDLRWRLPNAAQISDPAVRVAFQSLGRQLGAADTTITVNLEESTANLEWLAEYLGWAFLWTLPTVTVNNDHELQMRFSMFGIDSDGDPYYDRNGISTATDRAALSFEADGTPILVRLGGPAAEAPPSPPA